MEPNPQEVGKMLLDALEGIIPVIAQSLGDEKAQVVAQAGQVIQEFMQGGQQPAPGGAEMAGANPNAEPVR